MLNEDGCRAGPLSHREIQSAQNTLKFQFPLVQLSLLSRYKKSIVNYGVKFYKHLKLAKYYIDKRISVNNLSYVLPGKPRLLEVGVSILHIWFQLGPLSRYKEVHA